MCTVAVAACVRRRGTRTYCVARGGRESHPPLRAVSCACSNGPLSYCSMPATGAAARPPLLVDEESIFDWMQLHYRELLIALLIIIIAGGGVFLYRSASATQA